MTTLQTVPLTIGGASAFERRIVKATGEAPQAQSINTIQVKRISRGS
jgi:hypothetical protein